MAETIGAMYLRLGLNLSELETGFVTASQTVAANINRLSRESQLIRIRSQVEIEGLDETADAERIAQIRTDALNQQLAIQRDRVRILSSELQSTTAAHGANSVAVQRATIRFERERLTLAQLESELRNLSDTSSNVADSVNNSSSVFEDFSSLLPEIPTRLEAIGIAAGAMATGIGFATESINEMIEDFRELQKQSYELNMSFNDTKQFLREMKLAGGDIGDFEGYIRGITDAFVKGDATTPTVKYSFVDLSKLIDTYTPADNSVNISGHSIAVNLSATTGNALSLVNDGLFVDTSGKVDKVNNAPQGEIAIFGASGAIVAGGLSIADIQAGGSSYAVATSLESGLMSASDKAKLDTFNFADDADVESMLTGVFGVGSASNAYVPVSFASDSSIVNMLNDVFGAGSISSIERA